MPPSGVVFNCCAFHSQTKSNSLQSKNSLVGNIALWHTYTYNSSVNDQLLQVKLFWTEEVFECRDLFGAAVLCALRCVIFNSSSSCLRSRSVERRHRVMTDRTLPWRLWIIWIRITHVYSSLCHTHTFFLPTDKRLFLSYVSTGIANDGTIGRPPFDASFFHFLILHSCVMSFFALPHVYVRLHVRDNCMCRNVCTGMLRQLFVSLC